MSSARPPVGAGQIQDGARWLWLWLALGVTLAACVFALVTSVWPDWLGSGRQGLDDELNAPAGQPGQPRAVAAEAATGTGMNARPGLLAATDSIGGVSPGSSAATDAPEPPTQLLPPPASGSWEATPIISRARSLGRLGMDLDEQLSEAEPALSACFSKQSEARYAGLPVSEVSQAGIDDTGATMIVLDLEAGHGEVKVIDAPVEIRAGARDAALACVQEMLRGKRFAVQGEAPARRFRLRYALSP